jgi:hypothetical protein
MRYGESSHNYKEFDDDEIEDEAADAGRVVMTEKTIPHFPRRKANNSNIVGAGFGIRVPNSMAGVEFTTSPSVSYNPSRGYDSTPRPTRVPDTSFKVNPNLPKIGVGMMKSKKKRI